MTAIISWDSSSSIVIRSIVFSFGSIFFPILSSNSSHSLICVFRSKAISFRSRSSSIQSQLWNWERYTSHLSWYSSQSQSFLSLRFQILDCLVSICTIVLIWKNKLVYYLSTIFHHFSFFTYYKPKSSILFYPLVISRKIQNPVESFFSGVCLSVRVPYL